MKAVKLVLLTAAVCAANFVTVFADQPKRKVTKSGSLITTPAINWGSPEDVSAASIELLKTGSHSAIVPGNPEDVLSETVEELKTIPMIAYPEMVWGNAADVNF